MTQCGKNILACDMICVTAIGHAGTCSPASLPSYWKAPLQDIYNESTYAFNPADMWELNECGLITSTDHGWIATSKGKKYL